MGMFHDHFQILTRMTLIDDAQNSTSLAPSAPKFTKCHCGECCLVVAVWVGTDCLLTRADLPCGPRLPAVQAGIYQGRKRRMYACGILVVLIWSTCGPSVVASRYFRTILMSCMNLICFTSLEYDSCRENFSAQGNDHREGICDH
jgi:hypothetical protein